MQSANRLTPGYRLADLFATQIHTFPDRPTVGGQVSVWQKEQKKESKGDGGGVENVGRIATRALQETRRLIYMYTVYVCVWLTRFDGAPLFSVGVKRQKTQSTLERTTSCFCLAIQLLTVSWCGYFGQVWYTSTQR